MHGQSQNSHIGMCCFDPTGSLDAVHVGHGNVHQDDVGLKLGRQAQRLRAGFGFADDLQARIGGKQHAQAGTHDGVIIYQ